ncbi:MAG: hypothetical protein WBG86_05865 [Polyangiales bacterium]
MTPFLALVASALVPLVVCSTMRGWVLGKNAQEAPARDRALHRFRRSTFFVGALAISCASVAGALSADAAFVARWGILGVWFLSSLCLVTAWVAVALSQRTGADAEAMSWWETLGRAVQTSSVVVAATGAATAILMTMGPALPLPAPAAAFLAAILCVIAVSIVSPWLMIVLGIWPMFRARIEVDGVSWRLAHLPAPNPFLTHVAAMPWLRAVLLTDGVLKRMPERYWRTLVEFEVTESKSSRIERLQRWLIAFPLSMIVFAGAAAAGAGDPRKLVAGVTLAVGFAFVVTWIANRQGARHIAMDHVGPSPRELAQTLRHLPPTYGQAMPPTSHKPLGSALYDRLFALGHDPGPRRPR